jgi:hypothetical protein
MGSRPSVGSMHDGGLVPHVENVHASGAGAQQYIIEMIADECENFLNPVTLNCIDK